MDYIDLFSVPVSITSKSQALALVGEWVREWRSNTGNEGNTSNTGSKSNTAPAIASRRRSGRAGNTGQKIPVGIACATRATCVTCVTFPKLITTPNPEMIVAAQSDPEFLKALQSADLAIPDGIGVVWAVKMLSNTSDTSNTSNTGSKSNTAPAIASRRRSGRAGNTGKSKNVSAGIACATRDTRDTRVTSLERLSGLDLMESLVSDLPGTILQGVSFKDHPLKVMLVGGRPGIAEKASSVLKQLTINNLPADQRAMSRERIVPEGEWQVKAGQQLTISAISGPADITTASPHELDELVNSINSFSPDLLFVAFGHGKQEKWLIANRDRLNVGVAMGVGGAFDQIADPSLRPPTYIDSIGLGWLYRLIREPWRFRRQLALVKFVGMVLAKILTISKR